MKLEKRDLSISMVKANIVLLPLSIVLLFAMLGISNLVIGLSSKGSFFEIASLVPTLILGVIIHEAIHGFTWMKLGNISFDQIKYGVNWKALMPYAHSKVPMRKDAYVIGAALPGIFLGVLPFIAGLVLGSDWITWFGIIFTVAAAGDMWVIWSVRNVPNDGMIQDHPSRAGCFAFEKTEAA